jgi:hypothetical protein
MNESEISQLLDESIQQILDGVPLDEVLNKHPIHAIELRSLIEVAWTAKLLKTNETIPASAINHSRSSFLARGALLRQREIPQTKKFLFFSQAIRYATIILVIFSTLLITGLASANTLPGDLLYPVKTNLERVKLSFVSNVPSRMEEEIKIDSRRASEVKDLLSTNRIEVVKFGGFLKRDNNHLISNWQVDQIPLVFAADFDTPLEELAGSDVVVSGMTQPQGVVLVDSLVQRIFHMEGSIDQINKETWRVGGLVVGISQQTQVNGTIETGTRVKVNAILFPESKWVVISANVEDSLPNRRTKTPLDTQPTTETPKPREIPEESEDDSSGDRNEDNGDGGSDSNQGDDFVNKNNSEENESENK